ncbi:LysM peptidoglycan-binding domain-containing protein [Bacillus sp. FJAT-29790]|uniref:LysM peptidoglycan-binding domain-containing protein n=1 Tax=Bacillus sp. FJAT-29790 TaxID=1895002 RepID=UPI001C223151|nr:LysM peptidoglycan-binding domain-containing protein [Bacillus sp. FJAT-29790]MBU8881081.1 LysM peptidoglycan-binding domain-containing protein [Bacillus sp. FJAT-29790]
MEKLIIRTRKERILSEKGKQKKIRRSKLAGVTFAAAVAASSYHFASKEAKAISATYTVQKGDSLYRISKEYETTVNELKTINKLTTDKIYIGQELAIPTEFNTHEDSLQHTPSSPPSTSKEAKAISVTYTVQKGDSLYRISKEYETTVNELKTMNNLTSDKIYIGQELVISTEFNTRNDSLQHAAIYTVVPGDTLGGIAKRFSLPVQELKKQNNLKSDMVLINQKLVIMEDIIYKKATVVGAADQFSVEFESNKQAYTLKVPYGTAPSYQKLAGKDVMISFKNGALIHIQ